MENASPVVEATPETSQKSVDTTQEIIKMLNSVQYLLTAGSFKGSDSALVVIATQFLIDFKKHLEASVKA